MMIVACALPWKLLLLHPNRMLVRNAFVNTIVILHFGYHYICHRNDHRDKHEAVVVVGVFTNEVDASLGCHVNRRREMRDCLLLTRQFSMVCSLFHRNACYGLCRVFRVENSQKNDIVL